MELVSRNDREADETRGKTLPARGGSPDRFGYEWDKYPQMRAAYEEQFRRWTPQLSEDDWRGKTFLDVGCGMGRNSYWPMKYGAAGGVAIDIDERSLRAARQVLADFPRSAEAHHALSRLLLGQGAADEAADHALEALLLQPGLTGCAETARRAFAAAFSSFVFPIWPIWGSSVIP